MASGTLSQLKKVHTITTILLACSMLIYQVVLILDELLDIKDLRSSDRIDFVGGLRGLEELKKRVDSGEMKMALALYPVSMQQIMDIADSGKIMPPKATWFEPKLRSGLIIHQAFVSIEYH